MGGAGWLQMPCHKHIYIIWHIQEVIFGLVSGIILGGSGAGFKCHAIIIIWHMQEFIFGLVSGFLFSVLFQVSFLGGAGAGFKCHAIIILSGTFKRLFSVLFQVSFLTGIRGSCQPISQHMHDYSTYFEELIVTSHAISTEEVSNAMPGQQRECQTRSTD